MFLSGQWHDRGRALPANRNGSECPHHPETSMKPCCTAGPMVGTLASYVATIQASRHGGIGCSLDDRPAIWKQRHFVRGGPELQNEIVVPHFAMRFQPQADFRKID